MSMLGMELAARGEEPTLQCAVCSESHQCNSLYMLHFLSPTPPFMPHKPSLCYYQGKPATQTVQRLLPSEP
jgi:hypothetical protein